MAQFPLSFPVFYQCAIEGHTSLFKYDAVNVLLLGSPKSQLDPLDKLSAPEVSNFSSGNKRIKDAVMTQLLSITTEEAERRIQLLGIQDIGMVAYSLKSLVAKVELGPDIRLKLSDAYRNGFLSFIAEVFLVAIKYPPKSVRLLTTEEKEAIAACWNNLEDRYEEPLTPSPTPKPSAAAESPPKKESETHKVTQEEIEHLISGTIVKSEQKEELDIVLDSANILYIPSLRKGGANEAINIILSSGITALSNFFEVEIHAGFPHFDFYEDQGMINKLLFGNHAKITVLHSFAPMKVSSLGNIEGYIAVSLDRNYFAEYWKEHQSEHPLQFFTTKERGEYKSSVSGEIGSIFTGSAVTALSDFISETFTFEAVDMCSIENLVRGDSLAFVGMLRFYILPYQFESYLLLDWPSAHVLMDKLEQFVED